MSNIKINLIILTISKKPSIGIYDFEQNNLIEIVLLNGQLSETLPIEFKKIHQKYSIKKIAFVNGPGSFMAIKIGYIFLRTFVIVHDEVELFGIDGFYFNKNSPIKAINNLWFVKNNNLSIEVKEYNSSIIEDSDFILPDLFIETDFSKNIEPIYILNAV